MTQAQSVAIESSQINSSGVLQVAGGGTGLSTVGTNGQVLTSNGTTLSWVTPTAQVYPGAGIANSTGSAWGTSYTTTGSGTVLALATSPTFVTPVLGAASASSMSVSGITSAAQFQINSGFFTVYTGAVSAGTGASVAVLTNNNGYQRMNGTIYITANESYNGQAIYNFAISQYGLSTNQIFNEGSIGLLVTASGSVNTMNIANNYSSNASYQVTILLHNMGNQASGVSTTLTRVF